MICQRFHNHIVNVFVTVRVYVSEVAQAHACRKAVDQCLMPVGATYAGMTEQQVLDKIRTTDLAETCRCVDVHPVASLGWVTRGAATEGVTPLFFLDKPGDLF